MNKTKPEILTIESIRWNEFASRLYGKEGCNFTGKGMDTHWICNNKRDRPLARKILESMGNIDIRNTMRYFSNHGGYCDCEILFNVDK